MNKRESREMVRYLRGKYPAMEQEHEDFWVTHFQKFDAQVARAAIDDLHKTHCNFDTKALQEKLAREMSKIEQRQQTIMSEKEIIDSQQASVDSIIASMSDEKLATCKAAIVRESPAGKFLEGANPRTSAVLKNLIAERFAGAKR